MINKPLPRPISEFLGIANAFTEGEEKILTASFDGRMMAIVDAVTKAGKDYSPDYGFIGIILDEIEADYGLKPIQLVEAYDVCEQRQLQAEEAIND